MTYVETANQYIDDVLSGVLPACQYVKQACQRQLDDLKNPPAGYHFDESKAARVCQFIELLPHIKGEWAGKPIKLEPWQIFILTTVFGWVDENGMRRFRTCYVEVPRKNAKSTLSSGVALYCLMADNEGGAEVYSAATTRDQAKITWQDAKAMVDRTPDMRAQFGVKAGANAVYVPDTSSSFKALSRDHGGNLDGLNTHCAVIDELHAHKTREVFDVMETSTGARRQSLMWLITTAGFNRAGICYEQRAYTLKVLNGFEDDTYFGIVYTIDEGDDPFDPLVWAKANPNYGVSVSPDDLARKAKKAQEMAAAQNNFLTKHLCVWVNAATAWMNMQAWDKCADESLKLESFHGKPCLIALDLASKVDIAAKVYIFPEEDRVTVFGRYYLPEDTVQNSGNSQYPGWVIEDRLVTTEGNVIDYDVIEQELLEDSTRFEVQEVPYDPFQATQLSTRMMAEGLPMVEMRPTVLNFSEPMKEVERLVLSGRLQHNGCPVLSWMMSNVVCKLDAKDNIYPNKEFPENKIDGVVALIMAVGRWMANDYNVASVYEDNEIFIL